MIQKITHIRNLWREISVNILIGAFFVLQLSIDILVKQLCFIFNIEIKIKYILFVF